jgi:hypothetical protein
MKKYTKKDVNYILEQIRKKGRNGDTILAHINPIESKILKSLGGSGTINPKTGLREYGGIFDFLSTPFRELGKGIGKLTGTKGGALGSKGTYWRKPTGAKADISNALSYGPLAAVGMNFLPKKTKKAVTSFGQKYVIPVGAAMLGNTFLPGTGGIIGGTIGGTLGADMRGSSLSEGAIRGGAIGTFLPSASSMAGSAANSIGFNSLGSTLSNYGTKNAILPALGFTGSTTTGIGKTGGILSTVNTLSNSTSNNKKKGLGVSAGDDTESYMQYLLAKEKKKDDMSFMDKLQSNSMDFLSKPKNLLALGTTGLTLYDRFNQPKPKTATQEGKELKERMLAQRLTPEELAAQEQYELQVEQAKRRNARKKFMPEERIEIDPLYTRVSTPEERERTGRWLNYYNNPQFSGNPTRI